MSGWLTTENKIEVVAVEGVEGEDDEATQQRRREAKLYDKFFKLGQKRGFIDPHRVQFAMDAPGAFEQLITFVMTIDKGVELYLSEFDTTLAELNDLKSSLRNFLRILIIDQSLQYNEAALAQFREKFGITVNVLSSLRTTKDLLVQVVATSLGAKWKNLSDEERQAMHEDLTYVLDTIQVVQNAPVTQIRKSLDKMKEKLDRVKGFLTKVQRTRIEMIDPEKAQVIKTEPFKMDPRAQERLETKVDVETTPQDPDSEEAVAERAEDAEASAKRKVTTSVIIYADATAEEVEEMFSLMNELGQEMFALHAEGDVKEGGKTEDGAITALHNLGPHLYKMDEALRRIQARAESSLKEPVPEGEFAFASTKIPKEQADTKEAS